jgi:hypothetical protein
MIRNRVLWSLLVLSGTAAAAGVALTPEAITKSVASLGARASLSRLYENKAKWSKLLAGIASGEPGWLDVAKRLHPVSDGGASEQLGLAVGEALEHRPANVLSLTLTEFRIEIVCGGPDVDDPRFDSYDLSMAAIEQRQRMLRALRISTLTAARDACVNELEKAKAGIAHFYGRGD